MGGRHLLTVPLPCRKCHYSLIVQPHAVLPWRRANTTRFWFLPLCYNFFFFLLFQSLPEGFTFTVSLWSLCIPSPGFFPIMETGIGADLLLHWFHHLKKCLCAQYQIHRCKVTLRLLGIWYWIPQLPQSHCFMELKGEMSLATTIMTSLHMYHHLNRINE